MPNILIIHGHPNPDSLSTALANRYGQGAETAGATVRHLRLRELTFDPVIAPDPMAPLEPDLHAAQAELQWSDHVAVFFPIYWTTAPALLKGFFDRTLLSDFAYRYDARGMPVGLLAGRSARMVTTMDTPRPWYWFIGRPAHHTVARGTLKFCGLSPVRETILFSTRKRSTEQLQADIERQATLAEQDVTATRKRTETQPPKTCAPLSVA